jgi:ribonuclease BN (tRNA processing enzyme)
MTMCLECGSDVAGAEERGSGSVSRRVLLGGIGGGAALGVGSLVAGALGGEASAAAARPPRASGGPRRVPARGLAVSLLGTAGGPPPHADRAGIATAVVVDGAVYLVDAGRAAVTQYVRAGLRLADLEAVLITHLHADHIADYFNLFMLGGWNAAQQGDTVPDSTPVYGPGRAGGLQPAFGGATVPTVSPANPTPGLADLTASAIDAYAYSTNVFVRDSAIRATGSLIDVHEIDLPDVGASFTTTAPPMDPFVVMEDDRVRVTAVLVPHGPVFPAFAFRFDTDHGSVTLSGDATYNDNLVALAQGTELLIHEAINLKGFKGPAVVVDHMLQSHVEVQDVGGVAQRAGAKRLALSHIGNIDGTIVDPVAWRRWAQKGYDGKVHVGSDLDVLAVGHVSTRSRRAV